MLNVNEYIISFFIVALGTSLPELVVDVNALRLGHHSIAIGDIVGSCIVDSTLSIGIGQALFPQDVTASLAVPTVLYTIFCSLIVFTLIAARKKVDKKVGILFISLYFLSYIFLFSFWIGV
jgi:cation:H+ antiporter